MSDDDAELLNDELQGVISAGQEQDMPVLQVSAEPELAATTTAATVPVVAASVAAPVNDDLQPGGVGSGLPEVKTGESAYDNMKLSEIRRLAESRGITGAKDMRKQALIEALKNAQSAVTFDLNEGVLELN
jgi:hypothetical protein